MTAPISDARQRELALDVTQSLILGAPAGSGKTELLTQRFLALLTTVNQPEQILALTFTRKAAAEMRERIVRSLRLAATEPCPKQAHAATTWQLAKAALKADQKFSWQLLQNPNRLRIKTLDAFCATLLKQLPILSKFGADLGISDEAEKLYRLAARDIILSVNEESFWQTALVNLLQHLDGQCEQVEQLLADMLAKREQWLPFIIAASKDDSLRHRLEQHLANVTLGCLQQIEELFPFEIGEALIPIARFAAEQLGKENDNPLAACLELTELPGNSLADVPAWLGLIHLLITPSSSTWRKQINKRIGLGPDAKQQKKQLASCIEALQAEDALLTALNELRICPPPSYSEDKWQIIDSLLTLLPVACAKLTLLFKQQQQIDFSEMTLTALNAFSQYEGISDLQLQLDHQISHLLIDEFQDTSTSQYQLITALTEGWQKGDGRTLFLVGDPMQSIYRFRQAQVGLFLQASEDGLPNVPLNAQNLCCNFRASQTLVDWINSRFKIIFPSKPDSHLGAISLSEATATKQLAGSGVNTFLCDDDKSQALHVVEQIKTLQQQKPGDSIAILVRARSQLSAILTQLKQHAISYQAIELEALSAKQLILDLWSLTKALLHPLDRQAWLSLLRTPWLGLSLDDIFIISQADATIWQSLEQYHRIEKLSADAKQRLAIAVPVLKSALDNERRLSLRDTVWHSFLGLAGHACLKHPAEFNDVMRFLSCLEQIESGAFLTDLAAVERKLAKLYASSQSDGEGSVHVMTIHKSKGLEFDHVFLPSLERGTNRSDSPLLLWQERINAAQQSELILAPIKARQADNDAIYDYLKQQERLKNNFELQRLLYVAVTRAKYSLWLSACLDSSTDEDPSFSPNKGSLLYLLWPCEREAFIASRVKTNAPSSEKDQNFAAKRLTINALQQLNQPLFTEAVSYQSGNRPTFELHGEHQTVGIIIHRMLEIIADSDLSLWDRAGIKNYQSSWLQQLAASGLNETSCIEASLTITQAIERSLQCPTGRWILSAHKEAQSEYSLSYWQKNKLKHITIDRTFVEDNTRWIIDYKLHSEHDQYLHQLHNYGKVLKKLDPRPQRLALYYPLSGQFVELTEQVATFTPPLVDQTFEQPREKT